ncbi:hypothetical protein EBQ34_01210 [Vandammella animalimorsus]|uniref:Uncharacterized protein n=2 Tax=Vandammella animalimorsus TaxID=2029117 RepID=A0A3M6RU05_9BURK|nr:hypothetical protein EBQ34_01210 [Vandammella animalimorsus]
MLEMAALDAIKLGLLWAWLVQGVSWAGNVLTFWVWLMFALVVLLLLAYARMPDPPTLALPRFRGKAAWLWQSLDAVQITALAGAGHFVLASVYFLTWFLSYALLGMSDASEEEAQP